MSSFRDTGQPKPKKRLRQGSLLENFSFTRKLKTPSLNKAMQESEHNQLDSSVTDNQSQSSESEAEDVQIIKSMTGNVASGSKTESSKNYSIEDNSDVSVVSEDLFPDFESDTILCNDESTSQNEIISIENLDLNRAPTCWQTLPPLWSDSSNVVLFNCNIIPNRIPQPFPKVYRDAWDGEHVRLPCSPLNMYPLKNPATGNEEIQSRWEIIERSLLKPICTTSDLREAILSYNSQYEARWKFDELNRFFTEILEPDETHFFFSNLLPKIVSLALQLPNLITHPIPLLKRDKNISVSFTQYQIGCLLANAFFCTFPRRNSQSYTSEYALYPDINFNRLFWNKKRDVKMEKFKCIFNYFKRITSNPPTGVVTFERRSLDKFPLWSASNEPLTKLYISAEGVIEKDGTCLLQVDFANKKVGGGVLGFGCVQEEIRFLICPELLLSRLLTERLGDSEVLLVTGCEQFNDHSGYSDNFSWEGDFVDVTPRDSWQRRCTQVVAMDAKSFREPITQYEPSWVGRELNKAFCGFNENSVPPENLSAIATGNWGCGVFHGDPRLKVLIQLMAASQAKRDLVYFTFGDESLRDTVETLYQALVQKNFTVGRLWKILRRFNDEVVLTKSDKSLYAFIFEVLAQE